MIYTIILIYTNIEYISYIFLLCLCKKLRNNISNVLVTLCNAMRTELCLPWLFEMDNLLLQKMNIK